MKYKFIYFSFSGLMLLISISSLVMWQLKPSIDFTGGSLLELQFSEGKYSEINRDDIKSKIEEVDSVSVSQVQPIGDQRIFSIRTKPIDEAKKNEIVSKLEESYSEKPVENKFETVGPTLGKELLIKTGVAVLLAALFIMIYVARQFKDRVYGLSAIVAMFHDAIILLGVFSLLGHFMNVEVDTLFVTALLTTLSFSVHDTIVVFDRIRERSKDKAIKGDFNMVASEAVSQTLVRSLNNSLTIIFMLSALFLLGGVTIHWFSLALLIGTVAGTYSSPFVAVPLLTVLNKPKD